MRATIKDIAKATGLSITTVSLVLNNKPNRIPQATRDVVLKAANELNYRPSHIAISMVTKKTSTIGLVLPDISNLYFSELAKVIETQFHANGYNVLLGNSNDSIERDFDYLNLFFERNVDAAIIVLSTQFKEKEKNYLYNMMKDDNIPIIILDRCMNDDRFLSVTLDQKLGGYLATNYLIKLGHKKIGCITGPNCLISATSRLEGYKSALLEAGIPFDKSLVFEGDFHVNSGSKALPYLLGQNVTAVFCANDMMAIGIYRESRRYHLTLPDDLSIVGFDDIFIDEFLEPPLTTIAQPVEKIGIQAVKLILSILDGNPLTAKDSVVFKPILKVRGSAVKYVESQ